MCTIMLCDTCKTEWTNILSILIQFFPTSNLIRTRTASHSQNDLIWRPKSPSSLMDYRVSIIKHFIISIQTDLVLLMATRKKMYTKLHSKVPADSSLVINFTLILNILVRNVLRRRAWELRIIYKSSKI